MRYPLYLLLLPSVVGWGMSAAAFAEDWKPLFNGKDLAGWEVIDGSPKAWKAENGLLACEGGGGGWLSTKKEYANFELELEFRVPPGGNSGVFLRSPHQGNPAYAGMEIQVLDDAAQEYAQLRPEQYTGSLYDVAAARPRATKPAGQWQSMRIVCDGRRVTVAVNGTLVVDTRLDDHPDKFATHPGLKRATGYIGLQNHDTRLEYRNLKLRELP